MEFEKWKNTKKFGSIGDYINQLEARHYRGVAAEWFTEELKKFDLSEWPQDWLVKIVGELRKLEQAVVNRRCS